MSNFSTIQYLKIDDIFDIIRKNEYMVNMIYRNDYIELKFEDVNILLLDDGVTKVLTVEDNTPAENMRLEEIVKYENLLCSENDFTDNIINVVYNENISFEIVRCKNRESVFTNKEEYINNITIHKNENKLLDAVADLKIDAKKDSPIITKIFKRENNLLRVETFEFEEGKRKVFYDPRYKFRAEGCYYPQYTINKDYKEYGEYRFYGREELEVYLNGRIFMNEPKEVVSYSVIKENIKSKLWNKGFYSKKISDTQLNYNVEKQKNISGITKVEDLYIVEFDEETNGMGEVLFDNPSYTGDSNIVSNLDYVGFGAVDDDYIPF